MDVETADLSLDIQRCLDFQDGEALRAELDSIVGVHGVEALQNWKEQKTKHKHRLVHILTCKNRCSALAHLAQVHGFSLDLQRDSDKCTPAHLAVWYKNEAAYEKLKELGADLSIENKYGESAEQKFRQERDRYDNLIVLDLELTSGFYQFELEAKILEVAIIVIDKDLKEKGRGNWQVGFNKEQLDGLGEFHERTSRDPAPGGEFPPLDGTKGGNGLLSDVLASTNSKEEVEQAMLKLVRQHCPENACPLVGFSVQCDREVLRVQMPQFYRYLHHQIIDISSITRLARQWAPRTVRAMDARPSGYNHRALGDAEESIAVLAWLKEHLFKDVPLAAGLLPAPSGAASAGAVDMPGGTSTDPTAQVEASILDAGDADEGVQVSEDRVQVECSKQSGWWGARGRPGVLTGAYQFEVELPVACLLRVGWAGLLSRRVPGGDASSFGYGGTGKRATTGVYVDYGEAYQRAGAVVTCCLDRRAAPGVISFSLDGHNFGEAFQLPEELAHVPLFPVVCGRGEWRALCRGSSLRYPVSGHQPVLLAVARGDGIAGPAGRLEPPVGSPVEARRHDCVQVGRRLVLHVLFGPWQGWHTCEVLDTHELGCYLRHEEDNFHENFYWNFLLGPKYRMELLPEGTTVPQWAIGAAAAAEPLQAARILRTTKLRVVQDAGAGLELSACEEGGYFVEKIDPLPGQAALKVGDLIVAASGHLLLGLTEQQVTQTFCKAYHDGASLVVGSYKELRQCSFMDVQRGVRKIISQATTEQPVREPPPLKRCRSSPAEKKHAHLWRGRLAVDELVGAGVDLLTCEVGYKVEEVYPHPGQDLRAGDIIVAVGGAVLIGLQHEQVEQSFADHFYDGVVIVVGDRAKVVECQPDDLREEARRLMALGSEGIFFERSRTY